MYIHGEGFIKTSLTRAKFIFNNDISMEVPAIYKNEKLLGVTIPDLGPDVAIGHHHLTVEITLNGQ